MLGITADYFLALLTYCLVLQYMPELHALVAAVLYSFTPALYAQSVSESARPLGAFWYSLSIVLLPNKGVLAMVLAACASVEK
jgi:asparagine N-glycosylation enzyme membrane subunit Stt3